MPSSLDNPFRPPIPPIDPEKEAFSIRARLGPEAEKAYRALKIPKPKPAPSTTPTPQDREDMAHGLEAHETKEQILQKWEDFFDTLGLPTKKTEDILSRTTVNDDGSISIEGNLDLGDFKTLPPFPTHIEEITGRLSLRSLESAKHLVLPDSLQELSLNSLKSAEHLVLPDSLQWLYLYSLTSADHLALPDSVRWLHLNALTSTEHLVLPDSVHVLSLGSLTSAERNTLRAKYPKVQIEPNP
jgi:hypothetical protein